MKKFLTILLSVVLCLSLAMAIGCGKDDGDYEVTAEEFATAIAFTNDTNYKILTTNTDEEHVDFYRDGDKYKMVMTDADGSEEMYCEKSADKYYGYAQNQGTWFKGEISEQHFIGQTSVLLNLGLEYNELTYNAETKAYEAASVELALGTATNVSLKFENNKVVSLSLQIEDATQTMAITYGGVSITMPTVA